MNEKIKHHKWYIVYMYAFVRYLKCGFNERNIHISAELRVCGIRLSIKDERFFIYFFDQKSYYCKKFRISCKLHSEFFFNRILNKSTIHNSPSINTDRMSGDEILIW